MICRRVCRKDQWSFRWWRSVYSAGAPPSQRAYSKVGLVLGAQIQAQYHFFTNSRSLNSHHKRDYRSISFGFRSCDYTTQAVVDPPTDGMVDVPLAQTGEGIAECELLKWFVEEGDQVEEFQPLCEVQSDKATIEITSRYSGKVFKVLHAPGDIVKVGETLLKMDVDENALSDQHSEASEHITPESADPNELDIADSGIRKADVGGVQSTPAVRNFAKEYGVNIEDVLGTGRDGRIMKEDIVNYAAQKGIMKGSSGPLGASSAGDQKLPVGSSTNTWEFGDRKVTLRAFQRAMVKSMTLAAKIPHFHYVEEINCNALVDLKTSFQKENTDPGVKHTFLPLMIKALSMALTKYPLLNSCFTEQPQELTVKGSHNIGIAMATPHGLVVPNIKRVQSLSILEITKELTRILQLALANKLSPEDISGGTITLSNIGSIGGKFGSPLINAPEVCIIAIGRIQKVPHFDESGNVYPATMMTINIGADHRVLDGASVAHFCNEWKLFIEKPELLTLHMR